MSSICFVQKLFLTFRIISIHNMFSPCSGKRRAFDKDSHVKGYERNDKSLFEKSR